MCRVKSYAYCVMYVQYESSAYALGIVVYTRGGRYTGM